MNTHTFSKYINPRGKQTSGALDIVMNTEERKRQIAICLCKVNSYSDREAYVIYYIHILLGSRVIARKQIARIPLLPKLVQSNIKKKRLSDELLLFNAL